MLFGPFGFLLGLCINWTVPDDNFWLHCNSTIFVWLPGLGAGLADGPYSPMSLWPQPPDVPGAPGSPMCLHAPTPRRACCPDFLTRAPLSLGAPCTVFFFTGLQALLVWVWALCPDEPVRPEPRRACGPVAPLRGDSLTSLWPHLPDEPVGPTPQRAWEGAPPR